MILNHNLASQSPNVSIIFYFTKTDALKSDLRGFLLPHCSPNSNHAAKRMYGCCCFFLSSLATHHTVNKLSFKLFMGLIAKYSMELRFVTTNFKESSIHFKNLRYF